MILRIQSFKQAAFWSTTIGAFSQLLALFFGMLMAAKFGAQESTDVLYYCLGVFALLSGLVQQVNVSVLVPETMRRREQVGEADAMAFINRFFAVFLAISLTVAGLIFLNPAATLTKISKFPIATLEANHQLVLWLVVAFPLQMVAQLLLDILVSYRFLTLPVILSCVARVINILFVYLFGGRWGVISAAMGMTLGFALQIVVNVLVLARVVRWQWTAWRTRIGRVVIHNILWSELGTLVSAAANYLPLLLFSGFSAGALTALNYARRMSRVPMDMLTSQFSAVTAVKFNELTAQREYGELNMAFERIARVTIFILVPLAALLALLGFDLVSFLFGHGRFRGEALHLAGLLFSIFVLNLPMTGFMTITARYLVARQAIRYGVLWQIFSNVLNAIIVVITIHFWGPVGYPIGLCIHLLAYMLIITISMVRRFPGIPIVSVWRTFAAVVTTATLAALPTIWLRDWLGGDASVWVVGMASAGIFCVAYGLLLWVWPPDRMAWKYCVNLVVSMYRKTFHRNAGLPGNK